MEREIQDKAWVCLPKEVRNALKIEYQRCVCGSYMEGFLEIIFGEHNLTSSNEPDETLMVRRRSVQTIYNDKMREKGHHAVSQSKKDMATGWINAMKFFFSKEKCQLDKAMTTSEEHSKIEAFEQNVAEFKKLESECVSAKEAQSNPKFKVGDKVKIVNVANPMMLNEIGIITEHCGKDSYRYKVKWCEDSVSTLEECYLEPYIEEKNDMEEKELDLCELLNMGDKVYNPTFGYGEVTLVSKKDEQYFSVNFKDAVLSVTFWPSGVSYQTFGKPSIYPSKDLYEKYPLDAYSAWMEWKRAKRKYILEVCIASWYDGEDGREDTNYSEPTHYLKFDSKEELEQAAEAIRKVLNDFIIKRK